MEDDAQQFAITDYRGNVLADNEVRERVQTLKLQIKDDANIISEMRQDDDFLLRYLHFTDFDPHQAYLQFKKFYKLLSNDAKWFDCASPVAIEEQVRKNMRLLLDTRDRDGRLIVISKFGNINTSQTTFHNLMNLDDIILEMGFRDPVMLRKGMCGIADVKDMSFRLMQWVTPANIIFMVRKLDSLPLKDLKLHCVNQSRYLNAMLSISWPFLPKIKQNIFIHGNNWESLYKHVDPASLPSEYGGTNPKSYDEYIEDMLGEDRTLVESTKYVKFFVKDSNC